MLEGECGCGAVTYRMMAEPIFVHCCHCRECQRQTGSAYVLNAFIEADRLEHEGRTSEHLLPTPSGKGQIITRCRECGVAVFSNYLIRGGGLRWVRVGTLKDPSKCPPKAQIFVASKQPWVPLHPDIPTFDAFYQFESDWPEKSYLRLKKALENFPSQ